MKKNKNRFYLLLTVFIFILLIGLAVYLESSNLLYAASAVPLLIVPFLPDFQSSQYIRTGKVKGDGEVTISKTADPYGSGHIIISFPPGFVDWRKHRLYFRTDEIKPAASNEVINEIAASVPVLKFDLVRHPRKPGWVGIQLANLAQRTQGMSYTTAEINRLVINASDMEETVARKRAAAASQSRRLQA